MYAGLSVSAVRTGHGPKLCGVCNVTCSPFVLEDICAGVFGEYTICPWI